MSGSLLNLLLHACVGLLHQYMGVPVCRGQSPLVLPFLSYNLTVFLASHTDVAGLAAGVLLGVNCGHTHQLVAADLGHRAQRQVYGLRVDHLQDDVLGVMKDEAAVAPFFLLAGEEAVVADVERGKPLLAELVASGALRCQDQDDVVIGRVHAVEVSKVQVGVWVEERVGLDLEALAAVRGVLRRFACVELCVAAEEDALQLATDGGAVAAAVVLH